MKISFNNLIKACIISLYVIILAGTTVRMTGSGMGCPDWPKCFGHLIPPTSEDQLLWEANKTFKKGVIIIKDEQLLVSKEKFQTKEEFDNVNWTPYTKHDYVTFNATHTWVEYINRLTSAIAGVFFLVLAFRSLKYWPTKKSIPVLSFLALAMLLFEAWLGKTVVDSNLAVSKISIHMLVALAMVAVLIIMLVQTKKSNHEGPYNSTFKNLIFFSLVLTIVQVVLGIEVRQFVDLGFKNIGFENKSLLNLSGNTNFLIHRSFSILVVLVNISVYFYMKKVKLNYRLPIWILILLGIEILSGILMYYVNFPFGTQAIHLFFAAILFGVQLLLLLEAWPKERSKEQLTS